MEQETNDIITLHDIGAEYSFDFVPRSFDDYIGQSALKQKLTVYTQAALMRGEPLDHMLLFGPPGLGKTTLSQIMAHVMQVQIKICSGPMLERTGDLVAILSGLDKNDILFIDEIHRMATHVEEILYTAMEQFRVDVILGQGPGAKSVSLPIAHFTLIGATTKSGLISAPLRSRFGITERLEYYTLEELQMIVLQNALFLSIELDPQGAHAIAKRARGTPRIAKKIVRRVRDFAQVHNNNRATHELVEEALAFLGIDEQGLTKVDNLILQKMIEHSNGGPIGLETLASLVGEDANTIETVYEPYLIKEGYIEKTARGRQIPAKKLPLLLKKTHGQTSII